MDVDQFRRMLSIVLMCIQTVLASIEEERLRMEECYSTKLVDYNLQHKTTSFCTSTVFCCSKWSPCSVSVSGMRAVGGG
jgi:hypothetical protein